MSAFTRPSPVASVSPHDDARRLADGLVQLGITADVHVGYGLALVSVWVGLVVWCDGDRYGWRSGWDTTRQRVIYAWHSAIDHERAARRVAFRYADLRRTHPLSEMIADLASAPAKLAGEDNR